MVIGIEAAMLQFPESSQREGDYMFQDSSQASAFEAAAYSATAYSTTAYSTARFSDCSDVVDTGFSFAFQPVVDIRSRETVGHEALVRGLSGESAATVLDAIRPENRYYFDQACRMHALKAAARRGITAAVHLNCTQVSPDNLALSIEATIESACQHGISPGRVVLEFGSLEMLGNPRQLDKAREMAHAAGLKVTADNVGVGEVGLKRLAVFRPDFAKLDRSLIRGIDTSARRQAIVLGVNATCRALNIEVIATGVERQEEMKWLKAAQIRLAQGFYFGHPTTDPIADRERSRQVA